MRYKFLIHEANISKTNPLTLLFLQNSIQDQKRNAVQNCKKKCLVEFSNLEISTF